jgi:hypothetical protein
MLSGAIYYSLRNQIEFFGWTGLGLLLLLAVRLPIGGLGEPPGRSLALLCALGLIGTGLISLYRLCFQQPQAEQLVKLDELLTRLERRRERPRKRAALP